MLSRPQREIPSPSSGTVWLKPHARRRAAESSRGLPPTARPGSRLMDMLCAAERAVKSRQVVTDISVYVGRHKTAGGGKHEAIHSLGGGWR
jgi:hypothetical protein